MVKCSRATSSAKNEWRAGNSKLFATPIMQASAASSQKWACPFQVTRPSTREIIMRQDCAVSSSARFGIQSATAPPSGASNRTGANCSAVITPSNQGECVVVSTYHVRAVACIQFSMMETV